MDTLKRLPSEYIPSLHIALDTIDLCEGDLNDALILSQLWLWDQGEPLPELVFQRRDSDGVKWFYPHRYYWRHDCYLDTKIVINSIYSLERKGLIAEKVLNGEWVLRPLWPDLNDEDVAYIKPLEVES